MKTSSIPALDLGEFSAEALAERYAEALAKFNATVAPDKARRDSLQTRRAAVERRINEINALLPSLGEDGSQAKRDGEAMFRGASVGELPEVEVANLRDELGQRRRERSGLVEACTMAGKALDATTARASEDFCRTVRPDHERLVGWDIHCAVALSRANDAERSFRLWFESQGVAISSMRAMSLPHVGVGRLDDYQSGVRHFLREAEENGFDVDMPPEVPANETWTHLHDRAVKRRLAEGAKAQAA